MTVVYSWLMTKVSSPFLDSDHTTSMNYAVHKGLKCPKS